MSDKIKGNYAIIETSNGRWIGKVAESKEEAIKKWNNRQPLEIHDIFEFQIQVVQVGEPDPTGRVKVGRVPQLTPYGISVHPATTYVVPELVIFFDDMHENDRRKHFKIIAEGNEILKRMTAAEAGIITPTPDQVGKINLQ